MTRDSREANAGSPILLFTHYSRAAFACKTAKALRTGFPKRNREQLSKNAWTPVNSHVLPSFYLCLFRPSPAHPRIPLDCIQNLDNNTPAQKRNVICGG